MGKNIVYFANLLHIVNFNFCSFYLILARIHSKLIFISVCCVSEDFSVIVRYFCKKGHGWWQMVQGLKEIHKYSRFLYYQQQETASLRCFITAFSIVLRVLTRNIVDYLINFEAIFPEILVCFLFICFDFWLFCLFVSFLLKKNLHNLFFERFSLEDKKGNADILKLVKYMHKIDFHSNILEKANFNTNRRVLNQKLNP